MFLLKNKIKAGVLPKSQKVVLGKIQDSRFKIQDSRQAGITLLLAILLLSSILAITFSLAAVMFIEVRDSGDLLKTEPAFYAATGIGEQAFFNLERGVCTATGGNCSYTINFANNVLMPTAPTILSTSMPIFIDKVKTGSIFPNSLNNYYFCTTAASGSSSSGCGYGKVTVNYITTNNSGGPLYAYLCEFDPTGQTSYLTAPCTQVNDLTHGVNQSYWKQADNGFYQNSDGSVTLTPTNPFVSWTITNSNLQQQLILTNPGSYGDVYAKIQTFGSDGITGKGLPYVGKTAVDINTINASVGRKIQVVVPNSSSVSGSGGSATGYTHHRQITINGSVPSPQLNFPVLINIPFGDPAGAAASLKTSVTSGQGYDIMFAKNSDGSGQLNSEIEKYDSSSGALVAWVNIDSTNFPSGLTNGTQFYMFYGKSGVSSPPNSPSAVWDSNYKGVWHMNNNPTGSAPQLLDSTSNGLNLTMQTFGTPGSHTPNSVNGQIGKGVYFNPANQYNGNYAGSSGNSGVGTNPRTFSGWVYFNSFMPNDANASNIFQFGASSGWNQPGVYLNLSNDTLLGFVTDRWSWYYTAASPAVSMATWYYVSVSYDGSTVNLYLNGSLVGSGSYSLSLTDNTVYLDPTTVPTYRPADATMDELRISSVVRSADWIKTEYNNQLNPSAFVVVGTEQ